MVHARAACGAFALLAAFTLARDYAVLQLALDGENLGEPLDLYSYPDVLASGEVALGQRQLTAGKHTLSLTIAGANAAAMKTYMVGLDYIRLVPR